MFQNIGIEIIIKESKRKDEAIIDLTTEVKGKKTEVKCLEKELHDKNNEIENILLNSVSKETFIRTQFQSLTSEVRKLKQEKADVKALNEKVIELEIKLRNKGHEADDFKEKYEYSQSMLKKKGEELGDLEEMSTKMIGDITKGIGEKLAVAKAKELELKSTLEKNEILESDLEELGKTFKHQNEDLIRIKGEEKKINEQLSSKNAELAESVQDRDEEIVKLKGQVNNLTKRFREKVKEIQETLSKYNETLKSKNEEIAEKAQDIIELKEHQATLGHLITKLKDSNGKQLEDIAQLKEVEAILRTNISEQKVNFEEYKKNKALVDSKAKSKKRKLITENKSSSKKVKLVDQNAMEVFTLQSNLQHPFEGYFPPSFESPISIQVSDQIASPLLCLEYNWPLISYQPNDLLLNLQFLLENNSSMLLFRTYENLIEENSLEDFEHVGSKRKKSEIFSSRKKFRISPANRPVYSLKYTI